MGKKAAKVIKHPAFQGRDPLRAADVKAVSVNSFGEAGNTLYENWDRTPLAFCGMSLSEDNSFILNASTFVLGDLQSQSFPTGKLWNFKEKPQLKIGKIDLSKFIFADKMESELLNHNQVNYNFVNKKGAVIPLEDFRSQAFLGFCLRLYVQPIEGTKVKLSIFCYPLSVEDMKKSHAQYDHHAFPGVLLHQLEANLGIEAEEMTDTKFGAPILPVFKVERPVEDTDHTPSATDVCAAMAALLRSVTMPEAKSSLKSLYERWDEIGEEGVSRIRLSTPDIIWPEAVAAAPSSGKKVSLYINFLSCILT